MQVKSGLDIVEKKCPKQLRGAKVGLLIHPASVTRKLDNASQVFLKIKEVKVSAFFGPQHGILGQTQDNMIEWEGFIDKNTNIPCYSLYGKTRKPTPEMLKDIDIIVIDLQDIGSRYYTFIWTMDLCMQACEEQGKSVIVLDKPNPIGGLKTEGTVLNPNYASFVGLKPLTIRHGMTIGEIGLYFKETFYPNLDFDVIKMDGWKRDMWFDDTKLKWVMPSPNMPTLETAIVYPGMCLLEGTLLSEGRGTTKPFEIFGSPFINPDKLVKKLNEFKLQGVFFRPLYFEPTFQKHSGKLCGGAQIHIIDKEKFKPFKIAVAILKAVKELYPKEKIWKDPPYEYETVNAPIDILAGTDRLRMDIEKNKSLKDMEIDWTKECAEFNKNIRENFLLYN